MNHIPPHLKSEINQVSHRLALRYEFETRAKLLAQFKDSLKSDVPLPVLFERLERIEAGQPPK